MFRPLDSLDIFFHLKKDAYSKKVFKYVVARDRLPKHIIYPSAYVINTHKSDQPGEHWLALYYDSNGFCTFFDSFARSPQEFGLENFIDRTSSGWTYSQTRVQDFLTSTCGHYCVYFILLMSRGLKLNDILTLFDDKNFLVNDFKISHLM
jgi:hypothetical protein